MTCFRNFLCWVGATAALWQAQAAAQLKEEDIKANVVAGCHLQMSEFGVDAIQLCVETEFEALKSVLAFPAEHASFVARCHRVNMGNSWAVIKTCAERDVAAEIDLNTYPPSAAERIKQCRAQFGALGSARVKQCVDH